MESETNPHTDSGGEKNQNKRVPVRLILPAASNLATKNGAVPGFFP
jgi:hypothetical protein